MAFDGKAIQSHAVPHKKEDGKALTPDGRRDTDANIGVKEYQGKLIVKLWDEYQIKAVIDIRNMWKDGEKTKLVTSKRNVVFDYKWKEEYKGRTAVERVNSRLDVSFGFENHYIRGLTKMKVRVSLALCVMLAMAIGRIKENQPKNLRSLVKAA